MVHDLIFTPEARDDLDAIYDYVSYRGGRVAALSFTDRVIDHCQGLLRSPERGTRRDELAPGLRITGFERRVTILFHLTAAAVVIDRVLYGGRDLGAAVHGEKP